MANLNTARDNKQFMSYTFPYNAVMAVLFHTLRIQMIQ